MNAINLNTTVDVEIRTGQFSDPVGNEQTTCDVSSLAIISDPLLGQTNLSSQTGQATRTEIVFIESNVSGIDVLRQGMGAGKEIYVLDAGQDGLQQIAAILAGRTGVDALHLVSHGSEGALNLGTVVLDKANLSDHRKVLQTIGNSLNADADILLYACNVGAGSGQQLIDQLALVTGADIAASNNLTGAQSMGGDWELEVTQGVIETVAEVTPDLAQLYQKVLSISSTTVTFESAADILDGGGHKYATQDITYQVNSDSNYKLAINGTKTGMEYARNNVYKNSYIRFDPYNAYKTETAIALNFFKGQVFTPTGLDICQVPPVCKLA